MMTFISAFVVCGGICLAGQLIYDNTKLTAGHITSIFVVIGAALDTFGWYDKLLEFAGMGASLPITTGRLRRRKATVSWGFYLVCLI